jgi:outer membrane lipoprotein-sorting protein
MKLKALAFFFLFLTLPLFSAQADTWETLRQNGTLVKSVRADFVQEKHLKILARPIISRGTFIFQVPGSLRWEYISPIKSILLIHNGRTKKFIQRDGELVSEPGMSFAAMQIVLQDISQWLSGNFTENPGFIASLEDERQIVLRPRNKAMTRLINKIELKLSAQPGLMDSVTIYEGPDSFTRLTFFNAELNQEIDSALFMEK